MIDVTVSEGTVSDVQWTELSGLLTTAVLRAERAPDTPFFRAATRIYLHELPASHVVSAGRPAQPPALRVDVTTPAGALSERRRREMVADITAVLRDVLEIPKDHLASVWVLSREIADGSWGVGGQVVEYARLRSEAAAQRMGSEAGL